MSEDNKAGAPDTHDYVFGKGYAWFALALLTLVSAFSLLDRMIVTILAGEIKADLGLSDSEMGLLYGTVFAIFYALFGIPLGRLGDSWVRTRLVAIGLASWSFMTMLSGLAANTWQFALTRIGVGIGEASSGPSATSMLADFFPTKMRATVLALYSCGVSLGLGVSLWIGGSIVETWNAWFPDGNFPFGIKGWQAAFIAVAIPGMLLAMFVGRLKEPPRGVAEGTIQKESDRPFHETWQELKAIIPGVSFFFMISARVPVRTLVLNLVILAVLVVLATFATNISSGLLAAEKIQVIARFGDFELTGHTIQWGGIALGVYCIFSWAQTLQGRDAPSYALICRTPALIAVVIAGAFNMIITQGLMAWAPLYAVTEFHQSLSAVGLKFGGVAALAGLFGTVLGGVIGDHLQGKSPRGRLYVSLFAMVLPAPAAYVTLMQTSMNSYLACFFVLGVITTAWLPGMLSTMQDLVLPRMRGIVFATFNLGMTIIGLGTGPYLAGLISDATGSLKTGMLGLYLLAPVVWGCMAIALYGVNRAHQSRFERAKAAGETGLDI